MKESFSVRQDNHSVTVACGCSVTATNNTHSHYLWRTYEQMRAE
jgi:hypothetical protein